MMDKALHVIFISIISWYFIEALFGEEKEEEDFGLGDRFYTNVSNETDNSGNNTILEPLELGNKCLALPHVSNEKFRLLVRKKCYIDKTAYLHRMIESAGKFYFLSRPRRFGKTVLVDTLTEIFKGNEKLFRGTEIHRLRKGKWPTYKIIRIDLSGSIATRTSAKYFSESLKKVLHDIAHGNKINLINATEVESSIQQLIVFLSDKYKKPIVILIDNYDLPYTVSVLNNRDESYGIHEIILKFINVIKLEQDIVHFCFMAGTFRIAPPWYFDHFNGAVDITLDPDYAGIAGFNDEELREYFGGQIRAVAEACSDSEHNIVKGLREWHLGFQFTPKNESLYCPISIISYLNSNGDRVTSWSETGGASSLLLEQLEDIPDKDAYKVFGSSEAIQEKNRNMRSVDNPLVVNRTLLTDRMNFIDNKNLTNLVQLLFQSGYLSVASHNNKTDLFTLRLSNLEVIKYYAKCIYNVARKS